MTPRRLLEIDRYLVPEDAGRARRYLCDSLLIAHNRRERLVQRLGLMSGRDLAVRLLGRRRLLTEFQGAGSPFAAPLEMLAVTRDRPLADLRFRADAGDWILLRDYDARRGRALLFWFGDEGSTPSAIFKVRDDRRGASRPLRGEARALAALDEVLPTELRATAPELVAYEQRDDVEVMATSALPGSSPYGELYGARAVSAARVAEHLRAAASWLARFHVATRTGRKVAVAPGRSVPVSAGHGDYWARNVLLDAGGRLAVIDWEGFQSEASPLDDLLQFAFSYGLNYPWSRRGRLPAAAALRSTLLGDHHVAVATRGYFAAYCAEAGIEPALVAAALPGYVTRSTDLTGAAARELVSALAESGQVAAESTR